MLSIALFVGSSANAATIYYVQASAAGTNTWDAGYASSGTIVDLSTVNGGGTASFNAWFTDKSLATPVYSGTAFVSGDQVWIAKGTYYLTGVVTLKGGVSIYGGFAGTVGETVATRAKNSTDKWDFTNVTALDGSVSGTKTYIGITGGSATTTIVDGITIQNCTNGATNTSGAAAKIAGAGTTMQNCIVTGCTATGTATTGASAGVTLTNGTVKDSYIHHNTSSANGTNSGGITVYGNGCTVSGCKIDNNANTYSTTADGGGMFLYSSTSGVSISNCSFSNNSATRNGGGISSYITATNASAISISNCTFTSNTAAGSGGGAYLSSSIASNIYNISGCTFTSNSSAVASGSTAGGGAVLLTTCAFNIDKCTFTGNYTTLSSGGAITIPASSSCTFSNSKFISNTAGSTTASSGSAIYCKSIYTANNCLFADNTGATPIHFYTSTAVSTFQNCTFANNLTAAAAAAPIQLLNIGTGPTYPKYIFSNCLFYKVSVFSSQTNPSITTCASDIALSTCAITTLSTADFVDATNSTITSRNYQLSPTSLALNAGTDLTLATSPVTKDISDVSRPQGGTFDIGAYELPYFTTSVSYNSIGGSVSPATVSEAAQGSTQAYVITPVYGYQLGTITYNGVDVKSQLTNLIDGQNTYNGGTYTVSSLAGNYTLAVTFSQVITTGLADSKNQINYRVNKGILQIDGIENGTELSIFSISGTKIKSEKINGNNFSTALAQGIYLIKVGGSILKVAVN